MSRSPVKILIADSHFLIRQGLKSIFQPQFGFEVVAETEHFERVEELVQLNLPDIVIIGMNVQGVSAVELVPRLYADFPGIKVLVLDTNEDVDQIIRILESGVHGYILKQCDHTEILDAVQAMIQGKRFFCSNVLKLNKPVKNGDRSKAMDSSLSLSERELEILSLIAEGLTNKEIADKIFISSHTVASHRKNLMRKFQAKNNVDLVISAIKENKINP
jgi:DNA-binding NarL/FixJ family response regulator